MQLVAGTDDGYRAGRPYWRCRRHPSCPGTHGAHPDGRPLGIPADAATNRARAQAHASFDQLWQQKLVPSRGAAYAWLQSVMRLSEDEAHISRFTVAQCEQASRFAQLFIERWTKDASPIVNVFDDPWELAPPRTDPDDLDRIVYVETPPTFAAAPAAADVFCETPEGW